MGRRVCLSVVLVGVACAGGDTAPKFGSAGSGDELLPLGPDADGDGYLGDEDCDDTDPSIHVGAVERCNGVDDDCDGAVDEGLDDTWYVDGDGDGFGDADQTVEACDAPSGTVHNAGDCDDTDATVYPDAGELCDDKDNDCDGTIDEGATTDFYVDKDGDGHGDPDVSVEACEAPEDHVSAGRATDCDDEDPDRFLGNPEVCDDKDNDCDDEIDEGVKTTYYADLDTDGWGDPDVTTEACALPSGYAEVAGDCDDDEAAVRPDATEVCNGIDDDCDGDVDDDDPLLDTSTASTWYTDGDTDGYGDASAPVLACVQPSGTVTDATDCDDGERTVNPGETEVCNSIDDDCDGDIDDADPSLDPSTGGLWYADADTDGYGDASAPVQACVQPSGTVLNATDCDDGERAVNPGETEVCNGIDDDCDGDIDDDDPSLDASTASDWYTDDDGDGYGDVFSSVVACAQPSGSVSDSTDCNDRSRDVHPDATEVCNSMDDDCDGLMDDDDGSLDLSTATTWYADLDGDGYGDAFNSLITCDQPSSYGTDDTDCDDGLRLVNPGATEIWYDGVDQDCDGADDFDADGDGDPSEAHGGTDCDDDDGSVSGSAGCRPVVTCTHPDPATLAAYDPSGISDIVFDSDCNAWLPTIISGTDYVYELDSAGNTTIYTGTSDHDIGSIALDPSGSGFAVGYNNVNFVGYATGSTIPIIATSYAVQGSSWSNPYLNSSPASIAFDSTGCIWVPNFSGSGSLTCVETDGTETTIASGLSYIESVGLDRAEAVHVAIGDTIYSVDTATGVLTTAFVASDTVLDFVFDHNNDLYVENDAGEIERSPGDGSASSTFATVSGQGKLAIAPDGYLVRVIPAPVGAASYEEFAL